MHGFYFIHTFYLLKKLISGECLQQRDVKHDKSIAFVFLGTLYSLGNINLSNNKLNIFLHSYIITTWSFVWGMFKGDLSLDALTTELNKEQGMGRIVH